MAMLKPFFRKKWGCVGPVVVMGLIPTTWLVWRSGGDDLVLTLSFFGFVALGFAIDAVITQVMRLLGYPPRS